MNPFWTIAITTGLVGSLHCVGMCGPIALALPVGGFSLLKATWARLLYNLGRISTYSVLGYLVGYFGEQIFAAGFQQQLSIGLGVFLLISAFKTKLIQLRPVERFVMYTKAKMGKFLGIKTLKGIFMLGVLNGMLPCGMIYVALAGATTTASPLEGTIYMALFGLGTSPAMFLIGVLPSFFNLSFRQKVQKIVPIYSLLLALFLIARGIYISPIVQQNSAVMSVCHGVIGGN